MIKVVLSLLLSGLGRDALKLGAALLLAIVLAFGFTMSSLMALLASAAPGQTIASANLNEIPPEQLPVMRAAATLCGLPWPILAAIAKVESDFGRNMATSSAGAIGYGQFLPSTWAAFGNGGNPYDYRDALPAMARYLCATGAPGDLRAAIFAYNHADWYVNQVLAVAIRYGYRTGGTRSQQVVDLARAQVGLPYRFGGASPQTSFDCSGLVQWVYGQVGVTLPRNAQQQYDATSRVAQDQLEPGDLVFFTNTYPSDSLITHVGIYVGQGWMVNAPSESDVIREMRVFVGFWGEHYAGGGRP